MTTITSIAGNGAQGFEAYLKRAGVVRNGPGSDGCKLLPPDFAPRRGQAIQGRRGYSWDTPVGKLVWWRRGNICGAVPRKIQGQGYAGYIRYAGIRRFAHFFRIKRVTLDGRDSHHRSGRDRRHRYDDPPDR